MCVSSWKNCNVQIFFFFLQYMHSGPFSNIQNVCLLSVSLKNEIGKNNKSIRPQKNKIKPTYSYINKYIK